MTTPNRDELSADVLAELRELRTPRSSNKAEWNALEERMPLFACWFLGHENLPKRRLKKYQDQPWRCTRCGTWWVTEWACDYSDWDTGGHWEWKRVTEGS